MTHADMEDLIFGPDVTGDQAASGIFGLQHQDLLLSEYVENDALRVKFEFEVRPYTGDDASRLLPANPTMEMPAASVSANLLSLFEQERCTDVTFKVKGESIKAHSQVLAARSEVFERQFFGGLQESVSKEAVIDDTEPKIFKGFLKFLYTDDLEHVNATIRACLEGTSSSDTASGITNISLLQDLLALGHKYQVHHLLSWCQQQLCGRITDEEVCSVLCQAHLCEAERLEGVCLSYIKERMSKLASTAEFAKLTTDWPELLLKISLHASGVAPKDAAAAVFAQQAARKRKRQDES